MLYLSRRIGCEKVGVVDTDDGVEELHEIVDLGWKLQEARLGVAGFCVPTGLVYVIKPYQVPENATKEQAKLKTLFGVELSVFGNEITSIICDSINLSRDLPLRLSDFGASLGSCAFGGNRFSSMHGAYRLIFVLDDGFEFKDDSLCFPENDFYSSACLDSYAAFDLREMNNIAKVRAFYRQAALYDQSDLFSSLSSLIIDRPDRKAALVKWANNEADEANSAELEDEAYSEW